MRCFYFSLLLLVFFQPLSSAQDFGFNDLQYDLFRELTAAVDYEDDLPTGLLKMRKLFRDTYTDSIGSCTEEECIVLRYFSVAADFSFYQGEKKIPQEEVLAHYTSFFKEELSFLESKGLDLQQKLKMPDTKGNQPLWFQLWQASVSEYASGFFDLPMLGCTQALLAHGIGLNDKTGFKSSFGPDFKGAMVERFLGEADDFMADSMPELPNTKALKSVLSMPEMLNFTHKGRSYHMIIKDLELWDAYYLLVQLSELGYDLTKGDCTRCKGMNGLMVYAFSGIYGFGSQGEYYDEEMRSHLEKYKSNFNLKDKKGNTALHYAALNEASWYIHILIDLGADLNIKNNKGQTALNILEAKSKEVKSEDSGSALLGAGDGNKEEIFNLIKALKLAGAKSD